MMNKKFLILILSFNWIIAVIGQNNKKNAYLLRKHIDKDSTWIVENTGCYFLKESGLKENHFGWFMTKEVVKKESDLLYFEAQTFGSMQLVLEIPKDANTIDLAELPKKTFQLINHHYGNLRRDFEDKNNTIDILTGILKLNRINKEEVILNGIVNIDTKKPTTHQEIVFQEYRMKIQLIDEIIEKEKKIELENQKEERKRQEVYNIISTEKYRFYDSIFNLTKYPQNNIKVVRNKKQNFNYTLDNSYILLNATITDSAKADLMELLGGNMLATIQGNKKVLILHSLYDPIKEAIDDETNYSLSIEIDTIISGKTYKSNNNSSEFLAKLAFWHYGPAGYVVKSKKVEGTLTITQDNEIKTIGILDLKFTNSDKSKINLSGQFELPKLRLNKISELEENIRMKVAEYYKQTTKN